MASRAHRHHFRPSTNCYKLSNHVDPESCGLIGNGRHEALTGEDADRVWSPEIGLVLGADALRTRGRLHRGDRCGEVLTNPAGSETSGMPGNTVRGTREARHLAGHRRARSARGTHGVRP